MKVVRGYSTSRWTEWQRQLIGDVALVLVVGAIGIIGTYFAGQNQPEHQALDAVGLLLLVANAAALLVRRRYPALVLIFVTGITLLFLLLNYPAGTIFLAWIAAFFT